MRRGSWSIIAVAGLIAEISFGAGFQLYTEGSAEALGQAAAISGRTNMTSLAWYNPAGLAGAKETSIMIGSTFVQIRTDFDSVVAGKDASMSDKWRIVPHCYVVVPISDELTGMVALNAPYGLITEWSPGWIGDGIATLTDLSAFYATPSVAYRINEQLSVSAGFNIVSAEAELKKEALGPPGYSPKRTVEGDDIGYGYMLSAHYAVMDGWAIGGRYQSKVDLKIDGKNTSTGPAKADLTLPPTANVGIVNNSFEKLTLGADVVWTGWSTYDELDVGDKLAGTPTPSIKNWDDVWSIRVGAEYKLTPNWALRAGYVWDESPAPNTTRAPELPDSDRQMVTAGIGWTMEQLGIDLAYSFLWADKAKMGTDLTSLNSAFGGEYKTVTHLVSVSLRYSF